MSGRETDDPWTSEVDGDEVVFRLADAEHTLSGVRLWQELGIAGDRLDLARVEGGWELRLPRPDVHRMEYLFEVCDGEGDTTMWTDPTNPRVVGGAFGEHSWLAMPGYAEPDWVAVEPVESRTRSIVVSGTPVGEVPVDVWAPHDARPYEPLPLLVAHDGPEFAAYAGLTHYVGALLARADLPRMRLALVHPRERNAWYSADDGYAEALTRHVLPRIHRGWSTRRGATVLMGASLGALAALHAEWTRPGTFAGLFLQSGSFFTPATDPQERDFSHFAEVTGFVRAVLAATEPPSRPAVALTAGTAEENRLNNRVMAAHLRTLGYDVEYAERLDVHNYTAWRDMLHPHLTGLLQRVWGDPRGT
ncbi:MAG: alpha/beta hydrolase-fold protein [Actinomycetota bacterium]|nr:alpha/beta hydrolase-fold protein [Actinomycetota bacterium]